MSNIKVNTILGVNLRNLRQNLISIQIIYVFIINFDFEK
jgi:hypothetical protein